MKFIWDIDKERKNINKHQLDFSFAEKVFADPLAATVYDRYENNEHRYHTFGMVGDYTLLLVVHSYPDDQDEDLIRVIGLRKAEPEERRRYEKSNSTFNG